MKNNVSVIIPSFNGIALLKRNLPAVQKMLNSEDELLIIDDASADDTIKTITEEYHLILKTSTPMYQVWQNRIVYQNIPIHFTLIKNTKNLRFAACCNLAASVAKYQLLFLLNNDVRPEPHILSFLLPHFTDSTVFAVGCHEIEEHLGGISGGKNLLQFEKGLFFHRRATEFSSGTTAWASGGSAIFDKNKWQQLGGFDLDYYPAYWEDTDLSFRAHRQGWKVLFEANAVVFHNHETTNHSVFGQKRIEAISWKNAQKFLHKNGSLIQKVLFLAWWPYWKLKWLKYQQSRK